MKNANLAALFCDTQENVEYTAITKFFSDVNFSSEEETLNPENIEKTKQAFKNLCKDMDWFLAAFSFDELLKEKSGQFVFRADGITPNWYHELREIMPDLSMYIDGILSKEILKKHGTIEASIASKLRHDSWEDHNNTSRNIYNDFERELHNYDYIDEKTLLLLRQRSVAICNIIDLATRKEPKIEYTQDSDHAFITSENNKLVKQDRYAGDLNKYHQKLMSRPLAVLLKYSDSNEGLSTRIIEDKFDKEYGRFSVDDNMKYARERRYFYGRKATDEEVIKRYPEFEKSVRGLDSMLGINLVILETISDYYAKSSQLNPKYGFPIRVCDYLDHAAAAYKNVPKGFRPDYIQLGRLEKIAKTDNLMAGILEYSIYPALISLIGDKRGTFINHTQVSHDNGYQPI